MRIYLLKNREKNSFLTTAYFGEIEAMTKAKELSLQSTKNEHYDCVQFVEIKLAAYPKEENKENKSWWRCVRDIINDLFGLK